MARFISVAKAASIANVHATDIQKKIDCNQLVTTRGQIHIDDLVSCYPDVQVEQADMLSLVEKIKEQSFESGAAKQHGEVTISSLKKDLQMYKTNAEYFREQTIKFEELIVHIRENLSDTDDLKSSEQRNQRLKQWIDKRLAEIQRND